MKRRFVAAVSVAALMGLGTNGAFAGEITGNGLPKAVHGNSPCAFSGQEDLQWFQDEATDVVPVENPVKGVPAHSQNWGHVKQANGLTGGANNVEALDWGCNAQTFGLK